LNLLYRMFDTDGRLLYVGISTASLTFERMRSHKTSSHFFSLVRSITIEHFPSQRELREAEARAIKDECPIYNKQHNQQRCPDCGRLPGVHARRCKFSEIPA
jgi:excinuclease UvrABC nuclease subunit